MALGLLHAHVRVFKDELSYQRSVQLNAMLAAGVKKAEADGYLYEVRESRRLVRTDRKGVFRIERTPYLAIKAVA